MAVVANRNNLWDLVAANLKSLQSSNEDLYFPHESNRLLPVLTVGESIRGIHLRPPQNEHSLSFKENDPFLSQGQQSNSLTFENFDDNCKK